MFVGRQFARRVLEAGEPPIAREQAFPHGPADRLAPKNRKPGTEKPKDQLPSYHLTTTANPLACNL